MQDSIVRIEAARLRRAIERFYLKQEEQTGVCISIPKGAYVPQFLISEPSVDADTPAATGARPLHELGPRIVVENFDQVGDLGHYPTICRTLTRQVISALTRFTEIFVYGFETTEILETADHRPDGACRLAPDYRLLGTVAISRETLHVEVLMKRADDGRFVWADTLKRGLGVEPDPSRVIGLCAEIAGHVARVIALRDGIIDSQARDWAGDAPKHFAGYQKLLDFQDYWRSLDSALFEPLRRDLESTIASDPHFAAAFACLSMLYSNAARYGYDLSEVCDAPLEHALELARTAIHLAPNSSRAYHARAIAEWFSGRPDNSLATLQIARSLNPNDPELLAELGLRSAMRMEWETAAPLIEEAYLRNPLQTGQYRMGLYFYHFAEGRYEMALAATEAIEAPGVAVVHLAAAAALARAGRKDEARARLAEAQSLAPALRLKLREDLAFRQIHPDLVAAIAGAIEDADPSWAPTRTRRLRRV
jgi:TolB-like protein